LRRIDMTKGPPKPEVGQKPTVTCLSRTVLWIAAHDRLASSWRVWRGERTSGALELELARERRAGRRACIELETQACPPTEMAIVELVALGIVAETAS
jgi:hypothetical protein